MELRVLGSLALHAPGGGDVDALVRQSKRVALLAYLAAAAPAGFHRRDTLLAIFWPELDTPHARAALSQALYVVRQALGADALLTRGDGEVAVNPDVVRCDVRELEACLDRGDAAAALALYRGDLLHGFFVSDAPGFEQWLESERTRLRHRVSEGAWALADQKAEAGDAVSAARWARRAAEFAPADEATARRLMTFLNRIGDRAAALRAYEAFAWHLGTEYELEPSPETQALAVALREGGAHPASVRVVRLPTVPAILVAIRQRQPLAWLGVMALALTATLMVALWPEPPAVSSVRFTLEFVDASPVTGGVAGSTIALTPDARVLVYLAANDSGRALYQRPLARLESRIVSDTRGAYLPFVSPDGASIGYVLDGEIRRVQLAGGPSIRICDVGSVVYGASWGRGGIIVFATSAGLWKVAAQGGDAVLFARADTARGISYRWPEVLPAGRNVLFTRVDDQGFHLAVADLATGTAQDIGIDGTSPRFLPAGVVMFSRPDGALLAVPFDERRQKVTGAVFAVDEGVVVGMHGAARVGIASDGTFAYVPEQVGERSLVLVDRRGRIDTLPVARAGYHAARFSHDGRRIATTVFASGASQQDVWVFTFGRSGLTRVTYDRSSISPEWSPDDARIAFASFAGGQASGFAIQSMSAGASDSARTILPAEHGLIPLGFAPDRSLVVQRTAVRTRNDIWVVSPAGGMVLQVGTPANERAAVVSPDGRWIAYTSDVNGRDEVYLRPFASKGEPLQVSVGGGREPRWGAGELFYRAPAGMVAARITSTRGAEIADRQVLFDDRPFVGIPDGAAYDVHPDGRRLAMIRKGSQGRAVVVVLNWFEEWRATAR